MKIELKELHLQQILWHFCFDGISSQKCWYQHLGQLPGILSISFWIPRHLTKYYLHEKFQINWTIQTEIRKGAESALPGHTNLEKPGLFRVKLSNLMFFFFPIFLIDISVNTNFVLPLHYI